MSSFAALLSLTLLAFLECLFLRLLLLPDPTLAQRWASAVGVTFSPRMEQQVNVQLLHARRIRRLAFAALPASILGAQIVFGMMEVLAGRDIEIAVPSFLYPLAHPYAWFACYLVASGVTQLRLQLPHDGERRAALLKPRSRPEYVSTWVLYLIRITSALTVAVGIVALTVRPDFYIGMPWDRDDDVVIAIGLAIGSWLTFELFSYLLLRRPQTASTAEVGLVDDAMRMYSLNFLAREVATFTLLVLAWQFFHAWAAFDAAVQSALAQVSVVLLVLSTVAAMFVYLYLRSSVHRPAQRLAQWTTK